MPDPKRWGTNQTVKELVAPALPCATIAPNTTRLDNLEEGPIRRAVLVTISLLLSFVILVSL